MRNLNRKRMCDGKYELFAWVLISVLFLTGCGRIAPEETVQEPSLQTAGNTTASEESTGTADYDSENGQALEDSEKQETIESVESEATERGVHIVELYGYLKEQDADGCLIHSDSDAYPDVFRVELPGDIPEKEGLSEGDRVCIRMKDLEQVDAHGIRTFLALRIRNEKEETERCDTVRQFNAVPALYLTDALSSALNSFEPDSDQYTLHAGNKRITGTGAHALDRESLTARKILKLPQYNRMESVPFLLRSESMPDSLIVREWETGDAGNPEAEPVCTTAYYAAALLLELRADRIYELEAVWEQKDHAQNGSYGSAVYIFLTE